MKTLFFETKSLDISKNLTLFIKESMKKHRKYEILGLSSSTPSVEIFSRHIIIFKPYFYFLVIEIQDKR